MKTVLLLLLLSPVMLWAQAVRISPQDMQRKHSYLLLRDGSVVRGRVTRQDSSLITVRRPGGDLSFIETDQVVAVSASRPHQPVSSRSPYTVFILKDGSQVAGRFVRRDSTMITVRKSNGQLTYFEPELLVRQDSVLTEGSTVDSNRAFANRFSPWLLTGLTAYNAEKGRFYYRNTWLLTNEFDYGITRNLSLGASFVTTIPYVGDWLDTYYTIGNYSPNSARLFSKFSVSLSQSLRMGLNVGYQPSVNSSAYPQGVWTFQALLSMGSSQRNVTLSYGLIDRGKRRYYQYQPLSSSSMPITVDVPIPNQSFLSLGIMQKIGSNLTFLSDNQVKLGNYTYYYDSNYERATVSLALRLNRPRHAFDLGLYSLWYRPGQPWIDNRHVRILPYLSYNLLIGRN